MNKVSFRGNMNNYFFYLAGLVFLILSKVRNTFQGYKNPKPFSSLDIEKCIEYDRKIVQHWLNYLKIYTGEKISVSNKSILELGPGSDLGTGLILMAQGANSYTAVDVNNLAEVSDINFYTELLKSITDDYSINHQERLTSMLLNVSKNTSIDNGFTYIVDKDFEFEKYFERKSIDLMFSQAAFEHFTNVERVIQQISNIVKSNGILVAEVDLKSHSRWIRDYDPNNIYRYNKSLYRIVTMKGSPNRLRPIDYKNLLKKYGWKNIQIYPLKSIDNIRQISGLHKDFKESEKEMDILEIMLCATKE